jgi:hypothetical protein
MIGFGVGASSLGVEGGDGREVGGTGSFRIGYSVRPDLVLHFEGNGWSRTFDEPNGEVTWTFSTSTASVTWFPGNMGLFARGGIGIGFADVELRPPTGPKLSDDQSGLGFLVAGGYEWRLSRKFALAPEADFFYMDLGSDFLVESANSIGGSLNFNWYW